MIIGDELIGKLGRASFAGKCFTGLIVNESKETITMSVEGNEKILIKSRMELEIDNKPVPIQKLLKRPEDRIKLLKKRWKRKR